MNPSNANNSAANKATNAANAMKANAARGSGARGSGAPEPKDAYTYKDLEEIADLREDPANAFLGLNPASDKATNAANAMKANAARGRDAHPPKNTYTYKDLEEIADLREDPANAFLGLNPAAEDNLKED